jgi:hypothetical protein
MDGEGAGLTCHTAPVRDVERVVDSCAGASAGSVFVSTLRLGRARRLGTRDAVSLKSLCKTFAVTD